MGNGPSSEEGKFKGSSTDLTILGTKIKSKEVAKHVKKLDVDFPNLSELHVRQCRLKIIPNNICDLAALTVLDLDDNKISRAPEILHQLAHLKELVLSRNTITEFPHHLFSITSLTSLSLSHNPLERAHAINELASPAILDLRMEGTGLTAFPTKVCGLPTLRSLLLADNQLCILPPEITHLTSLTTLSLARNKFTSFPTEVFSLEQIQHIDLSENEMDAMWTPEQFTLINGFTGAHLTHLELQHNRISSLPDSLFDFLHSLVILKLHDNKLTVLPKYVSKLANLKELWLQENELAELPAEIGNLTSLRKLYLEYNELKTLPSNIQHLTNLVVLIMHHNQLAAIPPELKTMRQLLRLSLDDNPFQDEELLHRLKTEGALAVCLSAPPEEHSPVKVKRMSFTRSALKYVPNQTISRSLFRPEVSRRDSSNDLDFPRRKISNPEYPVTMHLSDGIPHSHSTSGPLNLTKSAGSIPSLLKRDKTSEDLIPAYSKFKGAFESLLEGQDFSKKKRELLQRMSKEQKWSLLTQYKDSTLHLLKKESSPNFTLRRHKTIIIRSPRDFCVALSGTLHPPQRTLRELHSMLSDGGSDVSTFIDLDGITYLVKFLANLAKSKNSETTTSLILESLNCMKVLVEIGLKSVLTTLDAINVVALHLSTQSEPVGLVVLDILREILDVSHLGIRMTKEALVYNKTTRGLASPYSPFLDILYNTEFNADIKVNCMNILNTIIDYSGGVASRFEVECELLILHLLDIVALLRDDPLCSELLKLELDVFEQSLDDDEQDMILLVGRKEVLRRLGHNLTPRDDIARVVVGHGGGVMGECINIPITPTSTCGHIVKEILTKYPIYSNLKAEWGLFVPDLKSDKRSAKEEGYWLDHTKRPAEYNLSGEILEFRMKELSILAGLRDSPCEILKVDPYLSITEITDLLRRKFKQNNVVVQDTEVDLYDDYWAEYGLYLYSAGHYSEGEWLDDTKKLSDYDTSLKRVALRLRPRPLAIAFGTAARAHHTLYFDPDLRIKDVVVEISRAIPAPDRANLDRYGLYLDSNDITKPATWLDEDKKLREYYIPKQAWVKFMRKPRPLKVKVAISIDMPTEVVVDQAAPVGDELSKLANQFSLPEDYDITVRHPDTKTVSSLSSQLTFAEQDVAENSTLFLKPKANAVAKEINIWDEPNWGEYKIEECATHSPSSPRHNQPLLPAQGSPSLLALEKKPALIQSATLNKMLEHLTSPDAYDPESRDVFLLTYPCFTTTQKLLEKLIERYTTPPSIEGSSLSRVIQQRVLVLCKHWLKFVEGTRKLANEVEDTFVAFFQDKESGKQEKFHEILELFNKCMSERAPEPVMVYSEQPPKPKIPKQITADQKLTWWDIDDQEIARQLTLLTFSVYVKIQSYELLQQNWMKSTTAAPYVNAMIGVFNKASQWVVTAVLSERLLRNRVKMLTKMIKVAQFLLEMNNFHLLMAFVSALNSSAIARLKWTQSKLSRHAKESLDELEKGMSMEGSFKSYRMALMEANPPCIPYIGVHLTDLVFIEEGNPRMLGPRINFVRHRLVAHAITSVLRYQKMPPNLVKVDVIQNFFASLPLVSEEKELFKMSLICEPRNSRAPPD